MTRRGVRHFPDRRAHQHRLRARRWFVVAAVVVLVVPWFGYRTVRSAMEGLRGDVAVAGPAAAPADPATPDASPTPPPAKTPPPTDATGRPVARALRKVASGPGQGPTAARAPARDPAALSALQVAGPAEQASPASLSARGQARVREAARQALLRDPRVGDAGWVDRRELDVVAAAAAPLSAADGSALCARLAAFGAVDDVVLRLGGAAPPGGLHPCGAAAGVAAPASRAPVAAAPSRAADIAALRAQVEADSAAAAADAARAARNAESMRLLEERVPEM